MTIWLDCFADNPVTGTVVQASDQSPIAGANVLLKNVEGKSIMPPSTSENICTEFLINK